MSALPVTSSVSRRPSPWWAATPILVCAGLSGLVLTACSRQPAERQVVSLPAVAVRTVPVETNRYAAAESVVGTVRARLRASLEPKLSGRILDLPVRAGQSVKKGQLLAQLDSLETEARLVQARAVLAQAEADLGRYTELFQQQAATRAELDGMEARQRVARATVTEVESLLGYARIQAPFDGVITRKFADIGDLAQPGRPVLDIEDPGSLRFEAGVPETLIGGLKLDTVLPVRIDPLPDLLEGRLTEIAPVADANTRTFAAKFDLPRMAGLRAGQFGRVEVPVGTLSLWTVPAAAVIQRGQMELVFVVDAGRAHLRLVRTGRHHGSDVEVVAGLQPGEIVVVEGMQHLVDGQPVTVAP
jgi:RND family efflux transporter MFP subunit